MNDKTHTQIFFFIMIVLYLKLFHVPWIKVFCTLFGKLCCIRFMYYLLLLLLFSSLYRTQQSRCLHPTRAPILQGYIAICIRAYPKRWTHKGFGAQCLRKNRKRAPSPARHTTPDPKEGAPWKIKRIDGGLRRSQDDGRLIIIIIHWNLNIYRVAWKYSPWLGRLINLISALQQNSHYHSHLLNETPLSFDSAARYSTANPRNVLARRLHHRHHHHTAAQAESFRRRWSFRSYMLMIIRIFQVWEISICLQHKFTYSSETVQCTRSAMCHYMQEKWNSLRE